MTTATKDRPLSADNITELAKVIVNKYEAKKDAGCEVCKGRKLMNDDFSEGMIKVVKDNKGIYRVMAASPSTLDFQPDEVESRPINYCPNCGKNLQKKDDSDGR